MTLDVERFAFLLRQRPICTQSPVKSSLGPDLHRELRAKYKLGLGLDLLDDRCPNSFNCIAADSGCIGRPLPIDDNILQALNDINAVVTKGIFKGREVYLAQAQLCSGCPFVTACDNPCATQESFLKRSVKPDLSPKGSMLVSYDDFEKGYYGEAMQANMDENSDDESWRTEELPLDCLSEQQRLIVEQIAYNGKTQVELESLLGIDQGLISRQYESGLLRMKEFGKARKYLKLYGGNQRVHMYYINNMIEEDIALDEGISRQAVNKTISQWRIKHGI